MRLLSFFIYVSICYLIFQLPWLIWSRPIPASLIFMYMFFSVVVILLVMTATEKGTRELLRPIKDLLEDPKKKKLRNFVLILIPVFVALLTFNSLRTRDLAPMELRSVHPSPPSSFEAFGKNVTLDSLSNPFSILRKTSPEKYSEALENGGKIYFEKCFFCHGAKLDGRGHYAHAMNPRPLPFTGKDTIAQLQESYVFWRIATGGIGLPREGAPWSTQMPAWKEFLTEEEIWQVILFIYDETGNVPSSKNIFGD